MARRVGAETVRCVYRRSEAEAPARVEEIRHAKEEGIDFFFLHSPVEILITEAGDVRAVRLQKMELGEPDERGRRKPVPLDEFIELACDTVIYALGTKPNPIIGQATPSLGLNKWGNIAADDDTQSTNLPGVFAGGDIVTGGATVILAMSAGRRAAKAIAAWLKTGQDQMACYGAGGRRLRRRKAGAPDRGGWRGALSAVSPAAGRLRGVHLLRRVRTAMALRRLRQGERRVRVPLWHVPALRRQAAGARAPRS
ncbi:MAG: FAD-dependent oxidoreductase [Rhodopila sp.]